MAGEAGEKRDEYQQRAGAILAAVAIQLVIEIGMDWRVLRLCQRLVPVDVRRAMRTLASAKNIGKFAQAVRDSPCSAMRRRGGLCSDSERGSRCLRRLHQSI